MEGNIMFDLKYQAGKTFKDSFFIGKDETDAKIISAEYIIPEDVQIEIEKNPDEFESGEKSPEGIAEQIKASVKDLEGFKKFCVEAEKYKEEMQLKKSAALKKEAKAGDPIQVTFQTEPIKQEKGTVDPNGPVITVDPKEMKSESNSVEDGKAIGSKVKQYFGGLPTGGSQIPVGTINPSSSLKDSYMKMTRALDEMKKENDGLKVELEKKGKELDEKNQEATNASKKKDVDAIIAEIKKLAKVDEKNSNTFVDMLVKVDEKALKVFLDVFKEMAKAKKDEDADKDVAGLFGGSGKESDKKAPTAVPDLTKSASRMPGQNIPQVFTQYNDVSTVRTLTDMLNEDSLR